MLAQVVVLASGSGTLFQSLIDSPARGKVFQIAALITDQPMSAAVARAESARIAVRRLPLADFQDRAAWDAALAAELSALAPDLVVSAGFMRILGPQVLARLAGRIINSHPALLPAFPGAHAVRDALAAGAKLTGCTVHFVDAGIDTGQVVVQEAVAVLPQDDEASLHERIKQVERRLLEQVVVQFATDPANMQRGIAHV